MMIVKLAFCVLLSVYTSYADQNGCQNVGALRVYYDSTCSTVPGPGCNAGGQGTNCRFCGFDIFPKCPEENESTTPKLTSPTSPTSPTTRRSTASRTTRAPSNSTGGPNPNPNPNPEPEPEYNDYGERLIFKDEFDRFDLKKWKHDLTMSGGGNWEFQLYHNNRTNSYVKDGVLYIKPTLTSDRIGEQNLRQNYRLDMWGGSIVDQCTGNMFYGCERLSGAGGNIINPVQSAKLTTVESFNFKYGRMEVVAKLPKGDWLWPAIWLLPRYNSYGMWPASGEIDVMEGRGNVNYPKEKGGGLSSFGSTLHWGMDWSQNRFELTNKYYHHNAPLNEEFHTYGLYWDEDRLYTYFDTPDNVVLDVDLKEQPFFDRGKFPSSYENPWKDADTSAPFDQEFYIIMNLAVGGTANYFQDGVAGKPWTNNDQNSVNRFYDAKSQWYPTWKGEESALRIDSVKVWKIEKNDE